MSKPTIKIKATVWQAGPSNQPAAPPVRFIEFDDMPPMLIVHWPSTSCEPILGRQPRFFVANVSTLMTGLRGEGNGLEYHEVTDVTDLAVCKEI